MRKAKAHPISRFLSLPFLAALFLGGCGGSTPPPGGGDIVEVVVQAERTTLSPGETIQARAEARTSEGSTVADARFDWSSSDPDVLAVDGQGKITAVSPGTARVKAIAVGTSISGTLDFRVSEAPSPPAGSVARVVLGPERGTLPIGASFQLLAEAFDAEGRLLEGIAFQWSSSDEGVLSVDAMGRVTAHAEGTATIRVEADSKAATADFEVEPQSDAPRSASWEPVEPIAYPRVYDLAVDAAGREIAATYYGDLHYRDGPGAPWVRVFANWYAWSAGSSVTPHPSDPDELWAVDNYDNVYVSRNGGLYLKLALDGNGIDRVVFHPLDENVLYVLSEGYARYRSADGGASWGALVPDCSSASADAIWSPADSGVLVALHGDGVLCRTRDGGATWEAATLPDGDGFTGLSFSPDGALWVMDHKYESGVGTRYRLHRSDDLGDTWTEAFATDDYGFSGRVYVHPADTNVVFVEPWSYPLWFSTDGGASFTQVSTSLQRVDHDPVDPAVLYGVASSADATGYYPVLRSGDYGQTWDPVGVGVRYTRDYSGVRFHSGRIYLLSDTGLWTSDDGGTSFTRIGENRGLASQPFHFGGLVAIDGLEPSTLWVRANDGLYRTTDAGEAWQVWGSGAPEQLARSPYDPQVWYGTEGRGDALHSADSGRTWTWVGRVPYQYDSWAPRLYPTSTPNLLYALAGGGVYRSSDGGATWEPRNQGLEHVPFYSGPSGFELVVHPDDPARLFLTTGHEGMYRSDDGGGSWYPINRGLANLEVSQLCLAADGQTLFAGARDGGVYVSLDLGGTWSFARTIGHYRVTDLACDPSDADVVYAATYGGVYKSTDKGSTWALASDGLTTPFVEQILVSQDGSRLYLWTSATGIFRGVPSDTEGAVFRTQGLEVMLQRAIETWGQRESP